MDLRLMNTSRTICWTLFLSLGFSCVAAFGQRPSDEPFAVFVAGEKTFARCGPSGEYYRTDPLRHGQRLDVYLETDDGWLGIRPPEKSFCWVPASAAKLHSGGKAAVITEDRTVCWIGTHLGRARKYRWQVQLAEGEEITILGRSERDGPDGPQMWYRVVPPPGEFRWVHRDEVVSSAEQLVASLKHRDRETELLEVQPAVAESRSRTAKELGNSILQQANAIKDRITGKPNRPQESAGLQVAENNPQLRPAPATVSSPRNATPSIVDLDRPVGSSVAEFAQPQPQPQPRPAASVLPEPVMQQEIARDSSQVATTEFISKPRLQDIDSVAGSAPITQPDEGSWRTGTLRPKPQSTIQQAAFNEAPVSAAATGPKPRYVSSSDITKVQNETRDADVDSLQLVLSRLMASRASSAEMDPVITRARNLAAMSDDQVIAGRARLLADKASKYQDIARRRDGSTVVREFGLPMAGGTSRDNLKRNTPAGGGIETGTLVQVYSSRPNSPPFALTDSSGNTIAYVTPSPGINLRMHLNNHVRVVGTRGYVQGINMPHIVVSQASRTQRSSSF